MSLAPGTRLGSYEVIALIGQGGMGEVYRCRDTKLGRDVALKILPETLAHDPERLSRFRREAHLLAALNYPHIATLHGLEDSGSVPALVMELVDGDTLAERIAGGPLSVDDALAIARQIGAALDAAHELGIVHRDLKPANVKVKADGTVKVLDFGLAKALDPVEPPGGTVALSTVTSPAVTGREAILGTAAYMAPEQARGRRVDKRADIWAFGCVLYEMVTGQRAFPGDNVTDTIASVIKDRPDLSRVPDPLRRLVRRCLEKDPKLRLRDIADAWELLDASDEETRQKVAPAPRRSLWIAGVVLLASLGVGLGWSLQPQPPSTSVVVSRFAHVVGDDQNLGPRLAVSRDGRHVAFTTNGQIHVRTLDDLEARPVPGTALGTAPGSVMPFFSPDGEWIAFFAEGRLMKVRAAGGTPTPLTQASPIAGASWGADNTIVFVQGAAIRRIPAEGGAAEVLVEAKDDEILSDPVMLPDGKTLLYGIASTSDSAETRSDNGRILAMQPGNPPKLLVQNGSGARYVGSGHLLYIIRNTLFALPFDANRLERTGDPVAVVESLRRERQSSIASYSVSDNGTLTFVPVTRSPRRLVWLDRQGQEDVVGLEPQTYANPRISPDGSKVALITRDGGYDVWVWDFSRRSLTQVTSDPSPNYTAAWLPDSKRLAFPFWTDSANQVHIRYADGSGQPQILEELTTPPTERTYPVSVSVAGELVYTRYGGFPIISRTGVLSLGKQDEAVTVLQNQRTDRNPTVSPGGRWMAFESDRTGRFEIYVSPFPDVQGGAQKVTTGGGTMPVWSRDQKHLYYWTVDGGTVTIMEVPVAIGQGFTWGQPRPVLQGAFERPTADTQYDVWNGRFLLLKAVERRESFPAIVIVQNWFEELKRRAPGQRR